MSLSKQTSGRFGLLFGENFFKKYWTSTIYFCQLFCLGWEEVLYDFILTVVRLGYLGLPFFSCKLHSHACGLYPCAHRVTASCWIPFGKIGKRMRALFYNCLNLLVINLLMEIHRIIYCQTHEFHTAQVYLEKRHLKSLTHLIYFFNQVHDLIFH